jgi:hypothetical protein
VVADDSGRVTLTTSLEDFEAADRAIRAELRRRRPDLGFPADPEGAPTEPPARDIRFVPLGAGRVNVGPLATAVPGRVAIFTTQFRFQEEGKDYVPYPVGRWIPSAEGLTADRGGAADFVAVRDPGERLSVVMSPRHSGTSRTWVLAGDGWLPPSQRGADVRADARGATYVDVSEARLYDIARSGAEQVLRFSPQEPGLTIHAFVFEREREPRR